MSIRAWVYFFAPTCRAKERPRGGLDTTTTHTRSTPEAARTRMPDDVYFLAVRRDTASAVSVSLSARGRSPRIGIGTRDCWLSDWTVFKFHASLYFDPRLLFKPSSCVTPNSLSLFELCLILPPNARKPALFVSELWTAKFKQCTHPL